MSHPLRLIFCVFYVSLAACSPPAERYFPLEAGTWRYYQTTTKILDETKHQRRISGIVEKKQTERGSIFVLRQAPAQDSYLQISNDGIYRLATRDRMLLTEKWEQTPQKLLPLDPKLGDSWVIDSRLGLIESRTFARQDRLRNRIIPVQLHYAVSSLQESVTVPAGTFDNCLLLNASGKVTVRTDRGNASAEVIVSRRDWYAPGVGLVKSVRVEESESPFLKPGSYEQSLMVLSKE